MHKYRDIWAYIPCFIPFPADMGILGLSQGIYYRYINISNITSFSVIIPILGKYKGIPQYCTKYWEYTEYSLILGILYIFGSIIRYFLHLLQIFRVYAVFNRINTNSTGIYTYNQYNTGIMSTLRITTVIGGFSPLLRQFSIVEGSLYFVSVV